MQLCINCVLVEVVDVNILTDSVQIYIYSVNFLPPFACMLHTTIWHWGMYINLTYGPEEEKFHEKRTTKQLWSVKILCTSCILTFCTKIVFTVIPGHLECSHINNHTMFYLANIPLIDYHLVLQFFLKIKEN